MSLGHGEKASSSGSVTTALPTARGLPVQGRPAPPGCPRPPRARSPTWLEIARNSATGTPCRDAASATPNPSIASAYPPRAASSAARGLAAGDRRNGQHRAPKGAADPQRRGCHLAATRTPTRPESGNHPATRHPDPPPRSGSPPPPRRRRRAPQTRRRYPRSPPARSRPEPGSARSPWPPQQLPAPTPPATTVTPGPNSASYGPSTPGSPAPSAAGDRVTLGVRPRSRPAGHRPADAAAVMQGGLQRERPQPAGRAAGALLGDHHVGVGAADVEREVLLATKDRRVQACCCCRFRW